MAKEATTETLLILQEQVNQRTTGKLFKAKGRNNKAGFIALAKSYQVAGDIDWDWVYENWTNRRFA